MFYSRSENLRLKLKKLINNASYCKNLAETRKKDKEN